VLNFEANRLYGSVPPEFARLRMLEQLQLGGNRLTGQLPAYLSAAPNLRYVALSQNQFMGAWCFEVTMIDLHVAFVDVCCLRVYTFLP
jgi:hypothetical protein